MSQNPWSQTSITRSEKNTVLALQFMVKNSEAESHELVVPQHENAYRLSWVELVGSVGLGELLTF